MSQANILTLGTHWADFARQQPELAAFGAERFASEVAYLGTLRADGGPRVHPVTPIVGQRLYLFMEPTSPKGRDLERDPRYALHCSVADSGGGDGEFYVRGQGYRVDDDAERAQAIAASPYTPQAHYILFVLTVEFAFMNQYINGQATPRRWQIAR